MTYSQIIGKRILELNKIRNYSVQHIAELSGLSKSTVQEIVNNVNSNPSLATLVLLAHGFEMNILTFLDIPELKNLSHEEAKGMRPRSKNKGNTQSATKK